MFIGNFPFNFGTRYRSDSNFMTAVCSWTMGLVRIAPDCRCTRQTSKQRNSSLRRWRCSWNVSHTIVVGPSGNGLQCARAMLQARDHFGVMGWRNDTGFVFHVKRYVEWTALAWKNGIFFVCKLLLSQFQSLIYIYIYTAVYILYIYCILLYARALTTSILDSVLVCTTCS